MLARRFGALGLVGKSGDLLRAAAPLRWGEELLTNRLTVAVGRQPTSQAVGGSLPIRVYVAEPVCPQQRLHDL